MGSQLDPLPFSRVGSRERASKSWLSATWLCETLKWVSPRDLGACHKVPGVQTGTVSRLLLGSPGIKSHSDVGATEQRREYYMGEGGGFPSSSGRGESSETVLLVACPNTKSVSEGELTNS